MLTNVTRCSNCCWRGRKNYGTLLLSAHHRHWDAVTRHCFAFLYTEGLALSFLAPGWTPLCCILSWSLLLRNTISTRIDQRHLGGRHGDSVFAGLQETTTTTTTQCMSCVLPRIGRGTITREEMGKGWISRQTCMVTGTQCQGSGSQDVFSLL